MLLLLAWLAFPASPALARRSVLRGTIHRGYADDFVRRRSVETWTLATEGGSVALRFTGIPPSLEPGARVRVTGALDGRVLTVRKIAVERAPGAAIRALTMTGVKKVAVILFDFQDSPPTPPFTPAQAQGSVFTNADSSNALYQEMSAGLLSLGGSLDPSGDVFGWYRVSANGDASAGICDDLTWAAEAEALAASDGFVAADYDHLIYAFPFTPRCGFYGGRAPDAVHVYINGFLQYPGNTAHELGHNYGLGHAYALVCTDKAGQHVSMSERCDTTAVHAYGDLFDLMGGATYFEPRHIGGWAKTQLGWIPTANTQTVTADGIYTFAPSEQPLAGQVQLVRILRPEFPINATDGFQDYVYLELRQPYGSFDDFPPADPVVNGVTIHVAQEYGGYKDRTYLIDTTAETTTFADAALLPGRSFHEPINDIEVRTLSVSPTGATVEIDVAPVEGKVGIAGSTLVYVAPPGRRDKITVRQSGADIELLDPAAILEDVDGPGGCSVSGYRATCPAAAVSAIDIDARDLDDTVRVRVALPGVIRGGDGKDRLYGGDAGNTLDGGAGDDRLSGGDGDDTLIGGDGTDLLNKSRGTDAFFGGDGDDRIRARDGIAEQVSCGAGIDQVRADPADVLVDCAP